MDAIVVTYNSAQEIARLLASQTLRGAFDRVVVVDNGSEDATVRIARGHGALVLDRSSNDGFAVGVNEGASISRGEAFAVLNPDIDLVTRNVVDRLENHLKRPEVGVAAPALELPSGALQDSAREVPSPLDLCRRRFFKQRPDEVFSETPVRVDWTVAACMVIKRDAFDAVGGFDERYFLYFEDVDFGVRLARAGYAVIYDPTVRVLHAHHGASRAALTTWATRQHIVSASRFYRAHNEYLWPRCWRAPRRRDGAPA
jgi:N-acetylglucosaminyl-diphospho-decaprenol L-rhamnosyltransferase